MQLWLSHENHQLVPVIIIHYVNQSIIFKNVCNVCQTSTYIRLDFWYQKLSTIMHSVEQNCLYWQERHASFLTDYD